VFQFAAPLSEAFSRISCFFNLIETLRGGSRIANSLGVELWLPLVYNYGFSGLDGWWQYAGVVFRKTAWAQSRRTCGYRNQPSGKQSRAIILALRRTSEALAVPLRRWRLGVDPGAGRFIAGAVEAHKSWQMLSRHVESAQKQKSSLYLWDRQIQVRGKVRASRQGFGMGVAFTEVVGADVARLAGLGKNPWGSPPSALDCPRA